MQPTPINVILDHLADGNAVPMVRGTLTGLWEFKSGTHAHGDWSLQNATLKAGNDSIPVMFKDRDEIPHHLKGQEIVVVAFSGQKGLTGIYAFDDTYKGDTKRKLKITKTADIYRACDYDEGPGHPEAERDYAPDKADQGWPDEGAIAREAEIERQKAMVAEHNRPQGQNVPAQQQPAQAQKKASSIEHDKLQAAKRTLVQIANLHVLCRMAMERQEAPLLKEITGRTMGEGEMQAATSSLFIKADKLGLHNDMPTRPFTSADFPNK